MNLSWQLIGLALQTFAALCIALWAITRFLKARGRD